MRKLALDLESGEWERRYSNQLALNAIDAEYRLVVAGLDNKPVSKLHGFDTV